VSGWSTEICSVLPMLLYYLMFGAVLVTLFNFSTLLASSAQCNSHRCSCSGGDSGCLCCLPPLECACRQNCQHTPARQHSA
jgi:hypothetical protein